MTSVPTERDTADDEAFLDRVFDVALTRLGEGIDFDAASFRSERPDLAGRITDAVRLARESLGLPVPPREIVGWSILRELGKGAMGVVYLARQDRLEREVALKVLPFAFALSSRARQRFRAEAQALARLHHPSIVSVIDIVENDDLLAFAMEYVEGVTLAEVLRGLRECGSCARAEDVESVLGARRGDLKCENVPGFMCRVVLSVARGLAVAHGASLLHRDVKPSNILLRRTGEAVLSDFGLVYDTDSILRTRTGQFVGTPAYASPEQLSGRPLDVRSDVYSLGITLYEALTLRLPYSGTTTAEILRDVERGSPAKPRTLNRQISHDLETIVLTAIDPDPKRRYATASDMADDIERVLRLEPIRARPPGRVSRALRWLRRFRFYLETIAVVTVVVAALGAFGVQFVLDRRDWPRRAAEHVRSARRNLIDPELRYRIFDQLAPSSSVRARRLGGTDRELLQRALREYDAALELLAEPSDVVDERDVVAAAIELGTGGRPTCERLAIRCPRTARFLRDLGSAGAGERLQAGSFEHWTNADRRALGLYFFLATEPELVMAAWADLPFAAGEDPLIEGMAGVILLERGEPAAAYPRILRAHEEWPEVVELTLDLADAARKCNDLDRAEYWLETTRGRIDRNSFAVGVRVRVTAQLAEARGEPDLAIEIYRAAWFRTFERASGYFLTPEGTVDFGRLLHERGDWDELLDLHRDLAPAAILNGMSRAVRDAHVTRLLDGAAHWARNLTAREVLGAMPDMLRYRDRVGWIEDLIEETPDPVARNYAARPTDVAWLRPERVGEPFELRDLIDVVRAGARPTSLPSWFRWLLVAERFGPGRPCGLFVESASRQPILAVAAVVGWELLRAPRCTGGFCARTQIVSSDWLHEIESVAPAGDIDADGFVDLVIGVLRSSASSDAGGVVGAYSGRDGRRLWTRLQRRGDGLGTVVGFGDANRDGFADVASGRHRYARATPLGGLVVLDGASGRVLAQRTGTRAAGGFGAGILPLLDLDGDGIAELLTVEEGVGVGSATWGDLEQRFDRLSILSGADLGDLVIHDLTLGASVPGVSTAFDGEPRLGYGDPVHGESRRGGLAVLPLRAAPRDDGEPLVSFRLEGDLVGDELGRVVVGAPDLDGDGDTEFLALLGASDMPGTDEIDPDGITEVLLIRGGNDPPVRVGGFEIGHYWRHALPTSAFVGDLDGDGISDLVCGERDGADRRGVVRAHSGAALARGERVEIGAMRGGEPGSRLGEYVVPVGDVDGDGIPDLAAPCRSGVQVISFAR